MTIRVDGEEIPEAAVEFEFNRLIRFFSDYMSPEEIRKQAPMFRQRARDQAIGAKLMIREAQRLDLPVSGDEVTIRLNDMIKRTGGRQGFEQALQRQRLTEEDFRKNLELSCKVDKLVAQATADVADPTEAEIEEHFKAHPKDYERPDRVQARHILIKPASAGETDRETAKSRLQEIRRRIEDGADFSAEAAAHSDCPSGKMTGGSLGWLSRHMTLPEFDQAIFSMEINELSDILETPLGFHVILKTDEEAGGPAEFDDVREKIRELLRHTRRGEALSAYVSGLRQKAVIEVDPAD